MSQFPSRDDATKAALDIREEAASDPDLVWFQSASLGDPVLVRTVSGEPSYWLVPMEYRCRAAGFVRVMANGAVGAYGRFGQGPSAPKALPMFVTGIGAREASRLASGLVSERETTSEPMYVHDGPPGREAWLIATCVAGAPSRWIFVTPGFVYERPAGEQLDTERE